MEIDNILNNYHLYNNKSDDEKQAFNNEISNILTAEDIKIRHKNNFINDRITAKVIQTLINIGLFVDINYQIYTLPIVKLDIGRNNKHYNYTIRTLLQHKLKLMSMLPVTYKNVDIVRKILVDNNVSISDINYENDDNTFQLYSNKLQQLINDISNEINRNTPLFNETPITYFAKTLINNNITFEAINSNQLRNEGRLYQLLNNNETYMYTVVKYKPNEPALEARNKFHEHMKHITTIKIINEKLEYNKLNNDIPPDKKTSLLTFHGSVGTNFLSLITNGLLTRGDVGIENSCELFGINAIYTGFDLSKLIYKDAYSINEPYYDIEHDEAEIKYDNADINNYDYKLREYIPFIEESKFEEVASNRAIMYGNHDRIYRTNINKNDYIVIKKSGYSTSYHQYFINYDSKIYVDKDIIVIKLMQPNYTLSGGITGAIFNYSPSKYVFQLVVEVDVGSVLVVNSADPEEILTKDNLMSIGCDSIIAPRYKIKTNESYESYIVKDGQLVRGGDINHFNRPELCGFLGFKLNRYTPLKYLRDEKDKYICIQNKSSHSLSVFNANQIAPKYLLVYSREST